MESLQLLDHHVEIETSFSQVRNCWILRGLIEPEAGFLTSHFWPPTQSFENVADRPTLLESRGSTEMGDKDKRGSEPSRESTAAWTKELISKEFSQQWPLEGTDLWKKLGNPFFQTSANLGHQEIDTTIACIFLTRQYQWRRPDWSFELTLKLMTWTEFLGRKSGHFK